LRICFFHEDADTMLGWHSQEAFDAPPNETSIASQFHKRRSIPVLIGVGVFALVFVLFSN